MENQSLQPNYNKNLSTPLSKKEVELAQELWHINTLTSFPIPDHQIEQWSKTINEFRPEQDLEKLRSVINMMKNGSIKFNSKLGIQNVLLALKEYDAIKIGYIDRQENAYDFNPHQRPIRDFYYEDDHYPNDMVWLVDKDTYEKNHLKPTKPKRGGYGYDVAN